MKRMKRRLLTLVLITAMVLTLPGSVFASEMGALLPSETKAPCTLTEGCTLDAGHSGDCVTDSGDASKMTTGETGQTAETESLETVDESMSDTQAAEESTKPTPTESESSESELSGDDTQNKNDPAAINMLGTGSSNGSDVINTEEALKAAIEAGGTVTLSSGIELVSTSFTVNKAVVLDLNGFTLTRTGSVNSPLFAVKNGGSLTLNDTVGTGGINSTYPVQLFSNASFTMNGGNIVSPNGAAIDIFTSASNVTVTMTGGSVLASADNTFGIRGSQNVHVAISGGKIGSSTNRLAMYVSGDRAGAIQLDISGGSIENEGQAIQAYSGAVINVSGNAYIHSKTNTAISTQSGYGVVELNVSGGNITSDSTMGYAVQAREKSVVNISGGTVSGATAVMADDQSKVTVSGGTLAGKRQAIKADSNDSPTVEVTGGKFSHDVSDFVSGGMTAGQDADGNWIVLPMTTVYAGGTGSNDSNKGNDEANAVATLTKALELIPDGGTVIVCGELALSGDMTVEDVSIERFPSYNGNLLKITNGTLSLNRVTVDGKKEAASSITTSGYLVNVGNGGTLNIGDGTRLINNGTVGVYMNSNAVALNMTGGEISGHTSTVDGGGIMAYGGTVTLSGGVISQNSSAGAGGGICYFANGNLNLSGTQITGNTSVCGGGVYVEGYMGSATFTMTGGAVTGNSLDPKHDGDGYYWMDSGAGICGYNGDAILNISGGTIADNSVGIKGMAEDPGVGAAISLNSGDGTTFPTLNLGGAPVISGDIFLWDEETDGPKINIADGFSGTTPLEVNANWSSEGTEVVYFSTGVNAREKESMFTTSNKQLMLLGEGNVLQWGKTVRISFYSPDNTTSYKKIYIRPDSAIDPAQAPTVESGLVTVPAGYKLSGWRAYGEKEYWDFTKTVPSGKATMTLLAVFGLKAPGVTVTADHTSVHMGETMTLTAVPAHAAVDVMYSYQWYKDGQPVANATAETLTVSESGNYTVAVKAAVGKLTSEETMSTAVVCEVTAHTYDSKWKSDGTNHWHECTLCGLRKDEAGHSGGTATCKDKAVCEVCGTSYGTVDASHHTGETQVRGQKAATCTAEGYTGDVYCTGCGEKLKDGAVIPEIAHTFGEWKVTKEPTESTKGEKQRACTVCGFTESEVLPELGHTHSFGSEWKSDATSHWHECSCQEKSDVAEHTFVWVVDKEASDKAVGLKHEECSICGYKKDAVESPVKPGTGTNQKPQNPNQNKPTESPKTGDSTNPILLFALCGISGVSLLVLWGYKRKKKAVK